MEPQLHTITIPLEGACPPTVIHNHEVATPLCAVCGTAIKAGSRFLTLSVSEEAGSSQPAAAPSSPFRKSSVTVRYSSKVAGSRRGSGRRPCSLPKSVRCHLKCLHCVECGLSLSGPPRGASSDDQGILFDKVGAAAAYGKAVSAKNNDRSHRDSAFAGGLSSWEEREERWLGSILKRFVAHATCAERVCAICGEVIYPGEQRIVLPRKNRECDRESDNVGSERASRRSRTIVSYGRPAQQHPGAGRYDSKKVISQHARCTRCATCGLPITPAQSQETSGTTGSSSGTGNAKLLLDDSGRPHHPSCMSCCCCRQPLFGGYEVHSFFGYQEVCQRALEDDPPLLHLPAGLAAALYCSAGMRRTQKTVQASNSTQNASSQQFKPVTPKFGGLCCTWCRGRVPCCMSCERRCAVYVDKRGQQFLPCELTLKARRAADLAASISLGRITPPQSEASKKKHAERKSATSSKYAQLRESVGDAIRQVPFTSANGMHSAKDGRNSRGFGGRASRVEENEVSETKGHYALKTAEMQGVLCGQCASLSVVQTTEQLKNCADTVLQYFCEEGINFSPEMIHLQQLMHKVSRDNQSKKTTPPVTRKSVSSRPDASTTVSAAASARTPKLIGRRVEQLRSSSLVSSHLSSENSASVKSKPLQQVVTAGLRVDLVSFDALNTRQAKQAPHLSLSLFAPSLTYLPPRSVRGSAVLSTPSNRRCSGIERLGESALPAVTVLTEVRTKEGIAERAPPNLATAASNKKSSSDLYNKVDTHLLPASGSLCSSHFLKAPERTVSASKLSSSARGLMNFRSRPLDLPFGDGINSTSPKVFFGRCHVVEVTLTVPADAAPQFEKQLRALQKKNLQRQATRVFLGSRELKQAGRAIDARRASSDVALKREETPVHGETLAAAAACAALVSKVDDSFSRQSSTDKREEGGDGDITPNVALAAGALLHKGSFAGGLIKTASGLHTQGLCVRVVKHLTIVGALPRILILQHLAHEFAHAFFACKQNVIEDIAAEEGACNVAAAAVLLHVGMNLKRVLKFCRDPTGDPSHVSGESGSCLSQSSQQFLPTSSSGNVGESFELLLLRYRLWKMRESTDEIYGVGYRRSLQAMQARGLTLGELFSQLLKGSWRHGWKTRS